MTKFDFAKARRLAAEALNQKELELLVLGHSGAGKSFCVGTLGVKTLYLYGTKEEHGPKSAATLGGANVVPMCFDAGEEKFSADESYEFLTAVLKDHAYLRSEGFKAIVVDGLAVLEAVVRETTEWKAACTNSNGKHNAFKETEASQMLMGRVIDLLKIARRELKVHIIMTGILDVKETDGFNAVVEAAPRLGSYGLAEAMNQHFGDIVVVGKMTRGGETKYKFQFMSDLVRASKDETGRQKKAMNFSPRLTGVADLPELMDANLAELAKLKAGAGSRVKS